MRIALISHDLKKEDFVAWTVRHQKQFENCKIFATGTTGGTTTTTDPTTSTVEQPTNPGEEFVG